MNELQMPLESGNNLFELIEFTVNRPKTEGAESTQNIQDKPMIYGVNVAKVREVIRTPEIVPCLTSCPEVLGVFNLRGLPVPAIHLALALGYENEPLSANSQMIVTEFSGRIAGFIVAGTRRIRRVNWEKVLPPTSDAFRSITGMMLIENSEFLFLLDFEQIMHKIDGKTGRKDLDTGNYAANNMVNNPIPAPVNTPQVSYAPQAEAVHNNDSPVIMVVDDSPVARRMVSDILRGLGIRVVEFSDGEQAWMALKDPGLKRDLGRLDGVVSDVEMPRLDGYSLVKNVRADSVLCKLPIILHSSLTGEVNRERGKIVGANAYVNKFNRREILDAINNILAISVKEAS